MEQPRIATGVWVNALSRRVHAHGDTAVVIAKGDSTSGAVLLVQRRRSGTSTVWYRVPQPDGHRAWAPAREQQDGKEDSIEDFLVKQRHFDPDLWIIELNTDELARFIDEPILIA